MKKKKCYFILPPSLRAFPNHEKKHIKMISNSIKDYLKFGAKKIKRTAKLGQPIVKIS